MNQWMTGCPLFLFISVRGGFPHDDVVQITRDHGQRLFANLWSAGRVYFESSNSRRSRSSSKTFPPSTEDPDNWVLASLRHVRFEDLMSNQRPDPNGSPAYTRKGYELIQKLKLNDVEARFATAVNGAESLQAIAKKIGIPLNDALLIVFRFRRAGDHRLLVAERPLAAGRPDRAAAGRTGGGVGDVAVTLRVTPEAKPTVRRLRCVSQTIAEMFISRGFPARSMLQ